MKETRYPLGFCLFTRNFNQIVLVSRGGGRVKGNGISPDNISNDFLFISTFQKFSLSYRTDQQTTC